MSREIKFRAWDKSSEYMHSNVQSGVYEDPDDWTEFNTVLGLECFEVMQYTGLKDKNGKEIFEGDVLYHHTLSESYVIKNDFKILAQISDFSRNYIEVIGNIYENPELLEATA